MNRRALYVLLSIVPWLDIGAKVVKIQSLSDYYDQPVKGYRPVFRARKNGPVRAYGDHFVSENVNDHHAPPNKTYKRTNENDDQAPAGLPSPPAAEHQPAEAGAKTSTGLNTDPVLLTLKTGHQTSPKDNAQKFLTTKCTTGHGEKKSAENNIDETTKTAKFTDPTQPPNAEPAPSHEETPDPSAPGDEATEDTGIKTTTRDPYDPPMLTRSAEFYSDDE